MAARHHLVAADRAETKKKVSGFVTVSDATFSLTKKEFVNGEELAMMELYFREHISHGLSLASVVRSTPVLGRDETKRGAFSI